MHKYIYIYIYIYVYIDIYVYLSTSWCIRNVFNWRPIVVRQFAVVDVCLCDARYASVYVGTHRYIGVYIFIYIYVDACAMC